MAVLFVAIVACVAYVARTGNDAPRAVTPAPAD
jgi:hypothetical protein